MDLLVKFSILLVFSSTGGLRILDCTGLRGRRSWYSFWPATSVTSSHPDPPTRRQTGGWTRQRSNTCARWDHTFLDPFLLFPHLTKASIYGVKSIKSIKSKEFYMVKYEDQKCLS